MGKFKVERYHDICCGHRVVGHEGKCRHLHGHNYRIHFTCQADNLDSIGRVIDFSVVKERLCMWLEENWDHKFLAWEKDKVMEYATKTMVNFNFVEDYFEDSMVFVPFNPTAENIAQYLVEVIGPQQLEGTGIRLVSVRVDETAKCSASFGI